MPPVLFPQQRSLEFVDGNHPLLASQCIYVLGARSWRVMAFAESVRCAAKRHSYLREPATNCVFVEKQPYAVGRKRADLSSEPLDLVGLFGFRPHHRRSTWRRFSMMPGSSVENIAVSAVAE
jgi:hypothetical protein